MNKIERKLLREFIKSTKGEAYKPRILKWFKLNLGKIVTSEQLAIIPGSDGKPISHNMRRVFELRDEDGYNIINHKDNKSLNLKLKVDEWILLEVNPNPKKIRNRGVNKRIMYEVFNRDNNTCQVCGRTPEDDDPFKEGHKIKLHVGHLKSHKQQDGSIANVGRKLTIEDFITLCNVCNEGAKNKDMKKISLLEALPE